MFSSFVFRMEVFRPAPFCLSLILCTKCTNCHYSNLPIFKLWATIAKLHKVPLFKLARSAESPRGACLVINPPASDFPGERFWKMYYIISTWVILRPVWEKVAQGWVDGFGGWAASCPSWVVSCISSGFPCLSVSGDSKYAHPTEASYGD